MKIITPDYYNEFQCIADKCRHTCCKGWEIDIDDVTLAKYNSIIEENSIFGKRLSASISTVGECACFELGEDERCPFLNEHNLCDIITELGEENLCQICADHPRFRSFFDSRTEIGLGLCCEEAARLILTRKQPTTLIEIESDGDDVKEFDEEIFFGMRELIFEILQDRTLTINERFDEVITRFDAYIPQKSVQEWKNIYLSLIRLDEQWTDTLQTLDIFPDNTYLDSCHTLPNTDIFHTTEWETAFEQLAVYFVFRHTAEGVYDGMLSQRIAFSLLSVYIIRALCIAYFYKENSVDISTMIEITRQYSSEIEYAEENVASLLELL